METRNASLEKMVATEQLRLTMETDEERKPGLEMMVVTTQLRLVLGTEEERGAKMDCNDPYKTRRSVEHWTHVLMVLG